jgi:hypothetical protein
VRKVGGAGVVSSEVHRIKSKDFSCSGTVEDGYLSSRKERAYSTPSFVGYI